MRDLKNKKLAKEKKTVMTVKKTDTGFSAFSQDYPIFTTENSVLELVNNAYDARELYFEEEEFKFARSDIKIEFDFK